MSEIEAGSSLNEIQVPIKAYGEMAVEMTMVKGLTEDAVKRLASLKIQIEQRFDRVETRFDLMDTQYWKPMSADDTNPAYFAGKPDRANCGALYPSTIKGSREYFSANVIAAIDI